MTHPRRRTVEGILIAVVLTTAVELVRGALPSSIYARAPLLPYLFPVVFAAWRGGVWPGLLALASNAIIAMNVIRSGSRVPDQIEEWLPVFLFVTLGAVISITFDALIRARTSSSNSTLCSRPELRSLPR